MRREALPLLLLAALMPTCVADGPPANSGPARGAVAPGSLLSRSAGDSAGPVTFPPESSGKRGRRAVGTGPTEGGVFASAPEVTSPYLDGTTPLDLTGDRLRLRFTEPMERPAAAETAKGQSRRGRASGLPKGAVAAAPGTLTFTPEVAGTVLWLDAFTLEFKADAPMKVGERYAVSLGDVKSEAGAPLAEKWRATAIPRVEVAGKILSYAPKPGAPKVVAMHPLDGSKVAPDAEIAVLYDQPIDLGIARQVLQLTISEGPPSPFVASHPLGPTFQGVAVDPRFVVVMKPVAPLERGKRYWLKAAATEKDGTASTLAFDVAPKLAITAVECDGSLGACSVDGTSVYADGTELAIVTNNALAGGRDLKKLVRVTPEVRNLSVYDRGWGEGRIAVSAAFEPSTRYEVTLVGLSDRFGSRLDKPFRAVFERAPLDASVTMPSGVLLLDEAHMKRFELTSRNTDVVELRFWPVADDRLGAAVGAVRVGSAPADAPALVVSVPVAAKKNELVTTAVDLTKTLENGKRYLVQAAVKGTVFDADAPANGSAMPLGLIFPGSAESLAVHVEKVAASTFVHVARLGTGEPVTGARLALLDDAETLAATSGEGGFARLAGDATGWLSVTSGSARALIDLRSADTTVAKLFPQLAVGEEAAADEPRTVLFTDRGIYRPGASVNVFASVRHADGSKLLPLVGRSVVVRVLGPGSEEVFRAPATTSERGSLSATFELAKGAKLGRHRVRIEEAGADGAMLAETILQVAEFEPPRFLVDVDARATDERSLRATVLARYLFGAPMDGAAVKWTAKREAAPIAEGPFTGGGFAFRPAREPWDERPKASAWARSGEVKASADGAARIEQALSLEGTAGPQRFVVEAEVSDSSHRAIAGRASAIVHPSARYAGVRVPRRWTAPGERLPVELAVVDREGKAVRGATVSARLRRVVYTSVARRDVGGALSYEWTRSTSPAGACSAKSDAGAVSCDLVMPSEGDYEIAAEVDGRAGGAVSVWAWGERGATSSNGRGPRLPNRGRAIDLVPDKGVYTPGETAKLLVTSPFAAATAIVTTDAPGATPRAVRIEGSAGVVDVPVSAADAPHVHAMVTLLPLTAAKGATSETAAEGGAVADYRIGAVRLPVTMADARLTLDVVPAKPSYGPREQAEIALRVADAKGPVRDAEIAIAVVDEGVLRMTGFHAPDPVTAMRPGRAFAAEVFDTRAGLADLVAQSHVAGDGDATPGKPRPRGETDRSVTNARKNFTQTAFWKPDVRTDSEGRAVVRFPLPDNLTDFRVMAVALDAEGRGAVTETSFTVTKPMLLAPALPRFVTLGDRFEAATLVHNNTGTAQWIHVALEGHERKLLVPANGHVRVPFALRVSCEDDDDDDDARDPGHVDDRDVNDRDMNDPDDADDDADHKDEIAACPTSTDGERAALHLHFDVRGDDGAELDAVEQTIPATFSGLDEWPRVDGAFAGSRSIALRVPAHIAAQDGKESLVIALGAQMWPELGDRLRFLLDYPHGCVEQTTSSTLPLLAARDIAPKIGMEMVSDADLRVKILAGIDRLATMRTSSGGLAYWPHGTEPNTYGTAYAIRALVLAKAAGIEPPKDLLDGMADYLQGRMLAADLEPEVQAAIAQSLAELGRLEPAASDALFDRREEQTVFGSASLALALSVLPGQDDRVRFFLDRVEAGLTDDGELRSPPRSSDFHYYGSPVRTKAQAAMALRKLRPTARALPALVRSLSAATAAYTTQATAYSLLALAEELRGLAAGAADATVWLDGREIAAARDLPGGGRQFEIPLADVAGKESTLELRSPSNEAVGFVVRAAWRRPADEAAKEAFHTAHGPDIHRVYTTPKGEPVDLATVRAGDLLRVALLVRRPEAVETSRYGYIAITDRLPAGFEPVQEDLATVAAQPDVGPSHPFAAWLRHADERASFLELHDDRVNVYFDTARGDDVAATYLIRATTPGKFAIPPATAELMYEPESLGATEPSRVIVK